MCKPKEPKLSRSWGPDVRSMRSASLPAAMSWTLLLACATPVPPLRHSPGFVPGALREACTSVWPLSEVQVDADLASTMGREHGEDAFRTAIPSKLQAAFGVTSSCAAPLPPEVERLLAGSEGEAFLGLTGLLPRVRTGGRFSFRSIGASSTEVRDIEAVLSGLSELERMRDVRYLVVPSRLSMWRAQRTRTDNPQHTVAETHAVLMVTVLDLATLSVVWEEWLGALASSNYFEGTALHEVEDDLVRDFMGDVQRHP